MNAPPHAGRAALKILFLCISAGMIAVSVYTSLQSDLFAEFGRLIREPWMAATLVDFYLNILLFSLWVIWRERRAVRALCWSAAFVLLGSIATAFYLFLRLRSLRADQPLERIFLRDEG